MTKEAKDKSLSQTELEQTENIGVVSVQGKRFYMEDAYTIVPNFRNSASELFLGVYDGHAGKKAAIRAANYLHLIIAQELKLNLIPEAIKNAFLRTDNQIRDLDEIDGTTAVIAYKNGDDLYIANAGDSRAVLGRNGKGIRLSHDHKADDPPEVERIIRAGGFVTSKYETVIPRVNEILAMSRALGDHGRDLDGFISPKPYIKQIRLDKNDGPLILASDGIWDVISDNSAIKLIKDIKDPRLAAEHLKNTALKKRSDDNITAIVLNLNT